MLDLGFQKVEDEYLRLKGQFALGRITSEQFDAALKELMVQDAQGRYWLIGADSGKWYMHDGTDWVEAQPPTTDVSITPTEIQIPARQSSRTLLIAIGGSVLVLMLGIVALLFAMSQGILTVSLGPTPTSPPPTAAPTLPQIFPTTAPSPIPLLPTTTSIPLSPTPTAQPVVASATKTPAQISVYCGLFGKSPQFAEAGQAVVLTWAWSAATDAYRRDYIGAASFSIKVDGQNIDTSVASQSLTSDSQGYVVTWRLPPRNFSPGTHQVIPSVTLSRQIMDGFKDKDGKLYVYDPGSETEPPCEIVVK